MQDELMNNELNIYSMILRVRNSQGELGGYDHSFFMTQITFYCIVCNGVPKSPYIVTCGHRVCSLCLGRLFEQATRDHTCPIDKIVLLQKDTLEDKRLSEQIRACNVRCPFSLTCNWVDQLKEVGNHFQSCTGVTGIFRSWMTSIQSCISTIDKRSTGIKDNMTNLNLLFNQYSQDSKKRYQEQQSFIKSINSKLENIRVEHKIDLNIASPTKHFNPSIENQQFNRANRWDSNIYNANSPGIPSNFNENYALNKPRDSETKLQDTNHGIPGVSFWKCAFCTYANVSLDTICNYCGRTRNDTPQPISNMCKCGFENMPNSNVCQNCNQRLT